MSRKPAIFLPKLTKRIALGIEYKGSRFHGWQRQKDVGSVQACLEEAISKVNNHPVRVKCAGRTDTGVHATRQIIHFDTQEIRSSKAWVYGTNSHLPPEIAVTWSVEVTEEFDSRFSAVSRRYFYIIYNSKVRPALYHDLVSHEHRCLDVQRMELAGQHLLGKNDFSSFRAANCQSNTPMRNVLHVKVSRLNHFVVIDIAANAFLYHMVRNIAGVLMDIGAGLQEPGWTRDLLAERNRAKASVTAPAKGLYLVDVQYPDKFALPVGPVSPAIVNRHF